MRKFVKRQWDRQRAAPVRLCSRCKGEIYPGQLCWYIGGVTLCRDCFSPWIQEELAAYCLPVEEVKG